MKCLDLFCGMGGWSIGFHREGYDCTGVDIVDVGYPYDLILSDIRDFHPTESPDVIVASPPCTEFSTLTMLSYRKGQRGPPEPEKGKELVKEALRVIEEAKPKYWVLENVYGSIPHLTDILGKPKVMAKPQILWGEFPGFMFQFEPKKRGDKKLCHSFELGKGGNRIGLPEDFTFDPLRSWKRARIPVFLAQTMAKVCKMEEAVIS